MKTLSCIPPTRALLYLGLGSLILGELGYASNNTASIERRTRERMEEDFYDLDSNDLSSSKSSRSSSGTSRAPSSSASASPKATNPKTANRAKVATPPPATQVTRSTRDSARSAPSTPTARLVDHDYTRYSPEDLLKHMMYSEQVLLDAVGEWFYDLDVRGYRIRNYTFIDNADAPYERNIRLQLVRGEESVTIQITFDERNQIKNLREIKQLNQEAEAWKIVRRVVMETNRGSVLGQLDCYADVVSPYFDKGTLEKREIRQHLRDWRTYYQHYHMRTIWTHVRKTRRADGISDYKVDVKFEVSWKAATGRFKHSRTYIITYGVRAGDEPKIVSAVLKKR